MKERLLVLLLVIGFGLSAIALAPSNEVRAASTLATISFRFTDANGAPMPNVEAAVYIEPYQISRSYAPALISTGTSDTDGYYKFPLDIPQSVDVPDGAPFVDLLVRAVDESHTLLGDWNSVVPVIGKYSERIPMTHDISAWDPDPSTMPATALLSVGITACLPLAPAEVDPQIAEVEDDPETVYLDSTEEAGLAEDALYCGLSVNTIDSDLPGGVTGTQGESGVIIDRKRRWDKVAEMHSAPGMRTRFQFTAGDFKELKLEVLTSGNPSAGWSVGGMALEGVNRGSGSIAPWKYHKFDRKWFARYRMYLYQTCHTPPYEEYCLYKWKAHHWTGGIKRGKEESWEAPFSTAYAEKLPLNGAFTRLKGNNRTFTTSVQLLGFSLKGNSGYEKNSLMTWEGIAGCNGTRWLYGASSDPTVTDVVNASCQ